MVASPRATTGKADHRRAQAPSVHFSEPPQRGTHGDAGAIAATGCNPPGSTIRAARASSV